jgi:hypothetical protein
MSEHTRDNPSRKLTEALFKMRERNARGMELGLKRAGLYLLAAAQYYVPVDTGTLRASGRVRKAAGTGGLNTVVEVSYSTYYAVYVHEDLTKRHGQVFNKHYAADIAAGRTHPRRPQEQAKFLEQALRESTPEMIRLVRAAIKEEK